MASVASAASAASNNCRALAYRDIRRCSLSALRQHYVASPPHPESKVGFSIQPTSKRSFHGMHERGRRQLATKITHNGCKSSWKRSTTAKKQDYDSDLVVVLDLDECLVHSKFLTSNHHNKSANQVDASSASSEHHRSSHAFDVVDTFHIALPDGELARVHQRPFLMEFLQQVSSKYETHLFTAGKEVYAKSILEHMDPQGYVFERCLFRDSCTYDPIMRAYVKNLDLHFGDSAKEESQGLQKTVLVDNNYLSFLTNPNNGILVSNFFDDPNDTTLLAVLDLLQELEHEDDVRPLLQDQFGLDDVLKRRREHEEAKQEQRRKQQHHHKQEEYAHWPEIQSMS